MMNFPIKAMSEENFIFETILLEEFHFPRSKLYVDADCTNPTYGSEVSPGHLSNIAIFLALGFIGCTLCSNIYADGEIYIEDNGV